MIKFASYIGNLDHPIASKFIVFFFRYVSFLYLSGSKFQDLDPKTMTKQDPNFYVLNLGFCSSINDFPTSEKPAFGDYAVRPAP